MSGYSLSRICQHARMALQPRLDIRVLVRGVIILNQMDVEVFGRFTIDLFQEPQPFDMGVALLGARDQLAFEDVERREQRHRAVARVIMRHRARSPRRQRQPEPGALQRLSERLPLTTNVRSLALFIATQHQRLFRRIKVKPDDVPELLLELQVVRELEGLDHMRLQVIF